MGKIRIVHPEGLTAEYGDVVRVELLSGACEFIATTPSPEAEAQRVARYAKEVHDWTWKLTQQIIDSLRTKHNGDASGREAETVLLRLCEDDIPLSRASIVKDYLKKATQ